LFIIDIATLSVDTVVERLLKKQAKQVIKSSIELTKKLKNTDELNNIDEIIEHFENVSGITKASLVGSGGVLKYFKIISKKMIAQEHNMSCATACIRQVSKDKKIILNEKTIKKIVKTC
jgi:hypothetical protein